MNELQVFQYGPRVVRTILVDGQLWFVAVDVCRVLDIANSRDALSRLDDDEKGVVSTDTPGGAQEVQAVNEPGLYSLVLGSRKPEAKAFKRWITHEVIPTIRNTGRYEVNTNNVVPLDERSVRMELLKTALDHEERLVGIEEHIALVDRKVEEQITLDSGQQRRVQKAVSKRIYELEDEPQRRSQMYRQLYREIKDRWAVPSYRDVRRTELSEVLNYVAVWKPRIA